MFGKEFPAFPAHLKRRRSHRKGERNTRVVPHSQRPPDVSVHSRETCFPCTAYFQAEDRLTPRWHVGHPCGKASWESLFGKPRGKAPNPLFLGKGSVTLLLQFGRKAHVHAPTRDEDSLPWGDSRSPPRPMSALQRNSQVPAPTPHKVLCRRPAPVDPGNSKCGRRWRGKTCLFINVRLD